MSWSRSLAETAVLGLVMMGGLLAFLSPASKAAADSVAPPATVKPVGSPPATVPGSGVVPQPQEDAQQPQPPDRNVDFLERPVRQTAKRSWGPEQAEGPPDTNGAGDIQTAWASQSQDGQKEWLICEYPEAVMPTAVVVHETYNPGSLEKVAVFDEDGKEHMAWMGSDPTPRTAARGTSVIPIKTKFKVRKVKLYFDSPAVPGWNEIDAVALKAKDNTQWAEKVTASSTYAQTPVPQPPVMVRVPAEDLKRLKELDQEVKTLQKEMQRMQQIEAELKELKELIKGLKPQDGASKEEKSSAAVPQKADPLAAYPQSPAFIANVAWLKEVGRNQIRTSWFFGGGPSVAMVCTADLSASTVATAREVYDHATQNTKQRQLSEAQVLTLGKLIQNLPPSAKVPDLENLILVSVPQANGQAEVFLYDRSHPPAAILRLYDLTGAYLQTIQMQ